jgi:hypothetical protein
MITLHQPPTLHRIILFILLPVILILWGLSFVLPAPKGRVVVVALDSLSPREVRTLVAQGKMPNFRWLMEHGYWNRLETDPSSLSRVIWPIIETGRPPALNGITGTGKTHISFQVDGMRQVPSLWEIVTQARQNAAVWNAYESYPAYKINGIFMTDRWLNDVLGKNTEGVYHPYAQGHSIAGKVSWGWENPPWSNYCAYITDGQGWNAEFGAKPDFADYFTKKSMALRVEFGGIAPLAARLSGDSDLTYYYNNTTDNFSHILLEGGNAGESRFEALYTMCDALVGVFLDNLDPNDHLIVLSDHGFNPIPAGKDNSVLIKRGAAGNFDELSAELYKDKEQAVTISRVMEEAEGWRIAFKPTSNPLLLRWFMTRLDLLYGEGLTDVRLEHAHTDSGISGMIAVYGPGVVNLTDAMEKPHILSITPTVLYLLGIPVGQDMEGGVARSLFTEGWLRSHPVRTVATWGTRHAAQNSTVSSEHLAEMKTLGYIQ